MKLLFGLAVAILVLATTLEVVNAEACQMGYAWAGQGMFCYRGGSSAGTFADAGSECGVDGATIATVDQLACLGSLQSPSYWVQGSSGCEMSFTGSGFSYVTDCQTTNSYVCVILTAALGATAGENGNGVCTLHDDLSLTTFDGATVNLGSRSGRVSLVKVDDADDNGCRIDVEVKLKKKSNEVETMEVKLGDQVVKFEHENIRVNGRKYHIDGSSGGSSSRSRTGSSDDSSDDSSEENDSLQEGLSLFEKDGYIVFESIPCGCSFKFGPENDSVVEVTLCAIYANKSQHLCGNFNGDDSDD